MSLLRHLKRRTKFSLTQSKLVRGCHAESHHDYACSSLLAAGKGIPCRVSPCSSLLAAGKGIHAESHHEYVASSCWDQSSLLLGTVNSVYVCNCGIYVGYLSCIN